jgi:hypothetical protein
LFGELPKLFGREFMIGYLLPIAVFIPSALWIASTFDNSSIREIANVITTTRDLPTLLGATLLIFTLWLLAIALLALNRVIIRAKEGYGAWNPARLCSFIEKWRFERARNRIRELDSEYLALSKLGQELDPASDRLRADLSRYLAERFPAEESHLLPTAFGNAIRAFEVYPHVMYGLDAIPAWPRLTMVMPEGSRTLIEAAKSQMDFWVNLWLLSLVLTLEYIGLAIFTQEFGNPLSLLALLLALLASNRARNAAIMWGESVKAAFDIYLSDLQEKLGLLDNLDPVRSRDQWSRLSIAMIFRDPRGLPVQRKSRAASDARPAKPMPQKGEDHE